MHSCLALPEIILSIAETIDDSSDLSRLTRSCRFFHDIAAPTLLRDIHVPLEKIEAVLTFSTSLPSFGCRSLRIFGLTKVEQGRGEAELPYDTFHTWCQHLAALLEIIGRHGTLRRFTWSCTSMLQPSYVPRVVWDALSAASKTLRTLNLDCFIMRIPSYDEAVHPAVFPGGSFPALRELTLFSGTKYGWDMAWVDRILETAPRLVTLLCFFPAATNFNLTSYHPQLRNLRIHCYLGCAVPGLAAFLHRHSSIEIAGFEGVQSTLGPRALPALKALLIDEHTLLPLEEYSQLKTSIRHVHLNNPPSLRDPWIIDRLAPFSANLVCLEIDWSQALLTRSPSGKLMSLGSILTNLRELGLCALITHETMAIDSTLFPRDFIRFLLVATSGYSQLVALRIQHSRVRPPSEDSAIWRNLPAVPPRLRYIAWDGPDRRSYYELRPVDDEVSAVEIEPPILRTPGTDWTGESIFDHLSTDPGY